MGKAPSGDPTGNAVRYASDDLHRRLTVDGSASSVVRS
jgi:hypothetical protein